MKRSATTYGRGFSLVEVLLAVLVLGLGLLGLAAIFPVVITQQREANESVAATGVVSNVQALISSGPYAERLNGLLLSPGFGRLMNTPPTDPAMSERNDDADWVRDGTMLWQPTFEWNGHSTVIGPVAGGAGSPSELLAASAGVQFNVGEVLLWDPNAVPTATFVRAMPNTAGHPGATTLSLEARLFPQPRSGADPRFIWDIVPRRNIANQLEIAVFVRAIETGIRVPPGGSLADVLRTNSPASAAAAGVQPRVPLGMNPDTIEPTGNGALVGGSGDAEYARPLAVEAELPDPGGNPFDFDLVVVRRPTALPGIDGLPGFTGDAWQGVISRPGQTVVDNLGVVRRITGEVRNPPPWLVVGANDVLVRVAPAYSSRAVRAAGAGDIVSATVDQRASQLHQFIFTPQPPVRVFVQTLR